MRMLPIGYHCELLGTQNLALQSKCLAVVRGGISDPWYLNSASRDA